jgi:cytochrome d ubiquinol oxidase subunit I
VPAGSVATSLVLFVLTYCFVFGLGIYYVLRLMRQPPEATAPMPGGEEVGSHRPLGAPALAVEERR